VEQLGAEGFRLELAGRRDARNVIALAPGGGIRGHYEQDDTSIGLRSIRADTLVVSELSWQLEAGRVHGSARMRDVEIDAVLPIGSARGTRPGMVGTIRASHVEATVDLELGALRLHGATVVLDDLEWLGDDRGHSSVRVSGARIVTLRGAVGDLQWNAADLVGDGAVSFERGVLRIESLTCGTLDVHHAQLSSPPGTSAPAPSSSAPSPRRDLAFLDLVCGRFGVDVTTDVTLPVLGSRQATHRVSLPVDDGIIDFRRLAKSLATLESLVLDFEVEDDRLVLEKDIPLVPFDSQPLVHWMLDPAGHALAKKDRVRVATLLRPELPASTKKAAETERRTKGKAVSLRRLDFDNIDVALGIEPSFDLAVAGGTLRFGARGAPAIGEVCLRGKLAHTPGAAPEGEVLLTGRTFTGAATGVRFGGRELDVASLRVETIERAAVGFAGFRPTTLSSQISSLSLTRLELRPGLPSDAQVG
jgi:hypothetical protein